MLRLHSIIIAAVVAVLSLPSVAHASTVESFTFTGTCSDCGASGGSGIATGTLVLQNYTLGTTLGIAQASDFVSFTYNSILQGTLTVSSSELNGLFVVLNDNLPNAEDVTINWTSTFVFNFETFASGTDWILTRGTPVDTGTNLGTWSASATPLPATLPLFATGLGAVGLLGWRRKRKAATAIAAT